MLCDTCGKPLCYCGLCHHCTVVELDADEFDTDELGVDPEEEFDDA